MAEPGYDVFISYKAEDLALAEDLNARLVAEGFKVWFDRARLDPGCNWYEEIEAGCEASRIILPVLTPRWQASQWTKFETYGHECVIPLLFEGDFETAAPTPLKEFQVVDLREIEPSIAALQNMPLMFKSWEEVDYVREKMRPAMEKKFLDKAFVVLAWGDAGWVRFFSKEPAVRPDDFKKMKFFAWGSEIEQQEIMKRLGYTPVPLETGDIPSGHYLAEEAPEAVLARLDGFLSR